MYAFPNGQVFTTIPGMPELGMVWMSDMMIQNDPSQELMIDPRQTENSYFATGHSFEDIRNHQIPPTAMVRYLTPQYANTCSEAQESMDGAVVQDIQPEYTQGDAEMSEYLGLDDYIVCEDQDQDQDQDQDPDQDPDLEEDQDPDQEVNNAATQTNDPRNKKIKPIKHPGLVLKTPIAYQPHTDMNFIPIRKDGIAVCEKCGAIGVKHAFYTKERRFCSRACARSSDSSLFQADSSNSSSFSSELKGDKSQNNTTKEGKAASNVTIKEELTNNKDFKNEQLKLQKEPLLVLEHIPVRRKRKPEMATSYDWTPELLSFGFCAAPVSCFRHAPISDIWDDLSVGMKVEVENTDSDEIGEEYPTSFWVATVLRISGYRALLRYEGFGDDASKDFWVSLCSNDIHPVGWCASIGKILTPPKTIKDKFCDWKMLLLRRLSGARTLPTHFYARVIASSESRFVCGTHLEVVDKNCISQVKVATVQKIVGKRLHVRYYDSPPEDNGFWCHEDSSLIHPVGWAKQVGHNIDAYPEYLERVNSGKLIPEDATSNLFVVPENELVKSIPQGYAFREGMKIEAIDPLNLSAICAATVMRVLRDGYIMIRIDSYPAAENGSDWFCYHSCSPCIFPVGFCAQHGLPLTPPKEYDSTTFDWSTYLAETNAVPAPMVLFERKTLQHGFVEGMRLEAADLMDPRLVCVATVTRIIGRLLKIHFDGWGDEYDQWLDCQSPDIYPVGWCDFVEHKLEGPRQYTGKTISPNAGKSPRNFKRKFKRKSRRNMNQKAPLTRSLMARQAEMLHQQQQLETQVPKKKNSENGPSQGSKVHRQRSDVISIPEQSLGPEPALEPAGPDQALPALTSDRSKISDSPLQYSMLRPSDKLPQQIFSCDSPKKRKTTVTTKSYENAPSMEQVETAKNGKYIPRIADGIPKNLETGELAPLEWSIFDVSQFLQVNDYSAYCDNFSNRKVDGKTLLNLTEAQVIEITGYKVGPSLKIFDLIQQIKNKLNPAQERSKLVHKKLL
ncbi:polycomb protein Sfmbt-like isoform X1 [Trichogramma pretiosum]|uniref:polycomb protein Sfmbt-like isoform X1 n=1 Tax=Trichogramma pretiosum TaxID=7493 RepID=UPI0006C9C0D1|nr:polycomb protein Sfmbt-like isoform X1 [Trichogramma pretiosum]